MSLQVWLPLTKDLRNQGLSNIGVTNNGATYSSTGGKLGGCYQFSNTYMSAPIPFTDLTNASLSCWVKIPSNSSGNAQIICFGNSASNAGCRFAMFQYGGSTKICLRAGDGTNHSAYNCLSTALTINTWYHVVCTYSLYTMKIYLNGELDTTYSINFNPSATNVTNIGIGGYYNGSERFTGYLNDVRIYNHCLSPMEVKQLSQGLILHYPLNRQGYGPTNLVRNGFGEKGNENWSNTLTYSDVPSEHPEIYCSYKDSTTIDYIPIYRNHNYKYSAWIKASSSSGNSYPSIKVFDADKLEIKTQHCKEGFVLSTMTTLSQPLTPGDTKIYATNLSAWNVNSGHYQNSVAIFDYVDSHGNVYPEGFYTRNVPAFASSTEAKTNVDKTNNIITLLSAYSGPAMPAGTKICATAYGNTYFYPFGGIANSTISNWSFKEATFSSETNRLSAGKYIKIYAYSTCYQAGTTLTDQTIVDGTTEYDCSGFCNNGTRTGTFTWSSDTPKYNVSQYFEDYTHAIHTSMGGFVPTEITMSCWVKSSNKSPRGSYHEPLNISSTNYEISIYYNGQLRTGYYLGSTRYTKLISGTSLLDGGWHLITTTCDGTTFKSYVDGVLVDTTTVSGAFTAMNTLCIGDLNGGTTYGSTELYESDVRIYMTALSASDVLSLYQNCATIDADGTIHGQIRS